MAQPKVTKTQKVLDFIRSKGVSGAKFSEIQRFIVELNGLDYDKTVVVNKWDVQQGAKPITARAYRGYWCDRLYGSMHGQPGLFPTFCYKGLNGNWVVK